MTTTQQLAQFAASASDNGIPNDVLDYTSMVLVDCMISAVATTGMARNRMSTTLSDKFAVSDDATILGSDKRSSVLGASYVNSDLMNILDADETFFNGAHFAAMSFAPAIAEAERLGLNGDQLVAAAAISFDISARLNVGTSLMEYDGEQFRFSKLSSHGYASLGAAAAVGVLNGFDADALANAFGLATWLAPTAKNNYMSQRRRFNSLKYSPNGGIATAGIMAAYMAQEGFEGDWDTLDTEPGFLDAQGYIGGDRSAISADLGDKWWILETSIKPYPACRFSHAAIDAIRQFVRDSGVSVDDIEEIEVLLGPAAHSISQFREPVSSLGDDHITPYAGQFNMPHLVAMAAAGVEPGPQWFTQGTLTDPTVQELTRKVRIGEDKDLAKEWHDTLQSGSGEKVRRTRGAVSIRAKGEQHTLEQDFALGDPWSEDTRMTWEMIRTKAHTFCDDVLTPVRVDALVDAFREPRNIRNLRTELAPLVSVDQ